MCSFIYILLLIKMEEIKKRKLSTNVIPCVGNIQIPFPSSIAQNILFLQEDHPEILSKIVYLIKRVSLLKLAYLCYHFVHDNAINFFKVISHLHYFRIKYVPHLCTF